jgi:protein-disulfide isomerase
MSRKTWIILGVSVVLIAAAGAAYYFLIDSDGTQASAAPTSGPGYTITADDMTIGNPKAKVVFIEYAAPICPHCARFNADVMPTIKESYVDSGKVFYVFRVFPLFPADGVAEKLARCMPKAKYFPFMDQLFKSQQSWDPEYGMNTDQQRQGLLLQAQIAGMSEGQFNACVADTKRDDVINKVAADGQAKYNITGTPTLVVNGTVVSPGTVPTLDQMRGFLDAALTGKPLN